MKTPEQYESKISKTTLTRFNSLKLQSCNHIETSPGVLIINFEHILHIILLFLLVTLNK